MLVLTVVGTGALLVGNNLPRFPFWDGEADLESEIQRVAEPQTVSQANLDAITITEAIKENLEDVPGEVEAFLFSAIYHIVRYGGLECAGYVAFLDPDTGTVNIFEIGERYECSDPVPEG